MSATMTLQGLADYQVLQRNKKDQAGVDVRGACQDSGPVMFRAIAKGKGGSDVASHWKIVGSSRNGRWTAKVRGMPVGGPFEMQFRVGHDEIVCVRNVLVGDLWVLAGQSNMEGIGDLDERVESPHRLVNSYGMNETWENATEPLHWLNESVDPVHNVNAGDKPPRGVPADKTWREGRTKGAGLGLAFAKAMVAQTGVPVGLIPSGHCGTSMAQWDPALKGQGGQSLYGSMLRRVKVCADQVAGVLWYQGESDANSVDVKKFIQANIDLVAAMRADFGAPAMPFLYVQIGSFYSPTDFAYWNQIQQLQWELESKLGRCGMVAAIDLPMDDFIHIGTDGQNRLGRRLATIAQRVVLSDKSVQVGPRPVSAWIDAKDSAQVFIKFSSVNGQLISPGIPAGFVVTTPEGHIRTGLYRTNLRGDTVQLKLDGPVAVNSLVQYGRALTSPCNLTDERDLPLPVFGPARIFAKPGQKWTKL